MCGEQDVAPLETVHTGFRNLPSPATLFVGREAELAQIEALLQEPQCRLISLVGLGGSGKTRLAIQAAVQSAVEAFPHGVCFVSLAAVSTPEGVISAIAGALQMPFYVQLGSGLALEAAQAQLLGYLADKKTLLVLDNVEHMLAEHLPAEHLPAEHLPAEHLLAEHLLAGHLAAEPLTGLIVSLLEAAPGVKLIATSRERLNLPGEWVLEVAGLPFPSNCDDETVPQYAAVQLFVEGARRAGLFAVAASDWPAIARICQLLGGMPLGVEMAAAWTKVLPCQEIAAELEHNLLALIATWRTVPERHRTLRTVFDHSWRLLSDEERGVVCRLSVFRGGFLREAAAEVAGASLSLLSALIDKSFLHRTSEQRFEIHPALRRYAAEKLAADPSVYAETRLRHARYYGKWLSLMNEKLKGGEQLAALAALQAETQNLHDAWRWFIEQRDLERLHGVLPAMILFHEMHGRPAEAQEVVRLLLDMLHALGHASSGGKDVVRPTAAAGPMTGSSEASLLALTLAALRHFGQALGQREQTDPYQQESLEIVRKLPDGMPGCDPTEKAYTLLLNSMGPGTLTARQSVDLCQQCIGIFERLGDTWGMALAQLALADAANFGGVDAEQARTSYQAGLESFARLDNDWGRAMCLTGLADVERRAGHLEEAYRIGCQSLDTYRWMGDTWREVLTRHMLGDIAEELGRLDEARRHFEANLLHLSKMGDNLRRDFYRERLRRLDEKAGVAAPPPGPPVAVGVLVEPLSAREIEVLHLLAEGLTNREIARQLYLSPNTVRVHTFHIYGKLGVNNRTQAVARARSLNLLTSP